MSKELHFDMSNLRRELVNNVRGKSLHQVSAEMNGVSPSILSRIAGWTWKKMTLFHVKNQSRSKVHPTLDVSIVASIVVVALQSIMASNAKYTAM